MARFATDGRYTIEVLSLRWAKRVDIVSYLEPHKNQMRYRIEVAHRGLLGYFDYDTPVERDAMWEKILEATQPRTTTPPARGPAAGAAGG